MKERARTGEDALDNAEAAAVAVDLGSADARAWFTTVCAAVENADTTWEDFTSELLKLAEAAGQSTVATEFVEYLGRDTADWQSTVRAMRDKGVDGLLAVNGTAPATAEPAALAVPEWDDGFGLFRRYNEDVERYEYAAERDSLLWECFIDDRWLRYDAAAGAWLPGTLPAPDGGTDEQPASAPEWDDGFGMFRRYNEDVERHEYAAERDSLLWECFVDDRWLRYDAATGAWLPGTLPAPAAETDGTGETTEDAALTDGVADVLRAVLDDFPEARGLSQDQLTRLLAEALRQPA
jgi:hypothetical protein